jgi:hypothetical protein
VADLWLVAYLVTADRARELLETRADSQ